MLPNLLVAESVKELSTTFTNFPHSLIGVFSVVCTSTNMIQYKLLVT